MLARDTNNSNPIQTRAKREIVSIYKHTSKYTFDFIYQSSDTRIEEKISNERSARYLGFIICSSKFEFKKSNL